MAYDAYLERRGKTWRFQIGVPRPLRKAVGLSHWKVPMGDCTAADAEVKRDALKAHFGERIARLRALPESERAQAAKDGTLKSIPLLREVCATFDGARERARALRLRDYPDHVALQVARYKDLLETDGDVDIRQPLARLEAVAAKVEPIDAADSLVDGLPKIWIKSKGTDWQGDSDPHFRTAALFESIVGRMNYRRVTDVHVGKFRDALENDPNMTPQQQARHLQHLSAMFTGAVKETQMPKRDHPVKGITVRSAAAQESIVKQQVLTAAQTRHILARAEATNFGGEFAEAVLWVLRLLAWTGARPTEILQLQRGDVGKIDGVAVIRIRKTCAVTGKPFPKRVGWKNLKRVKNENAPRIVPLHPAVAGFLDFAAGERAEWVFDCFRFNRQKGRYHWFGMHFGKFLKDECGIVAQDEAHRVSLYSWRHGFHRFMRRAKIDRDLQNVITGHASPDEHGKYGAGEELRYLAGELARVDVLADLPAVFADLPAMVD